MYIGIVIINYKTPELTIAGLQALFESEISYDFHVAIVENFSNDGSFEKIEIAIRENNWQNKVTMINSSFNGGFAYGCNLGIRFHQQRQSTDFFWMLNPDAAVRPQALEELIEVFKTNSKLGIAGSRLENKDGSKRNASFTFHSWKTEFLRGFGLAIFDRLMSANIQKIVSSEEDIHPSQTDWISGASMMIRKEVVDDIGYFDEKYFLYFEEMDYCLKAKKAGWQRWHVPKSRVMHFAGSSSGVNAVNQLEKRRPTYWFDSRRRFFIKNYGKFHAAVADLSWLIGFATWRLRNLIQQKKHKYPPHFLLDSMKNSVFFKGFKID